MITARPPRRHLAAIGWMRSPRHAGPFYAHRRAHAVAWARQRAIWHTDGIFITDATYEPETRGMTRGIR